MRVNKNELLFAAFVDLEALVQEYKRALLWLTHGNHEATPELLVQETREFMRELKEKITGLLDVIDLRTQ